MGSSVLRCFMIFLFCFFLTSDSGVAKKPPLEANRRIKKLIHHQDQIFESSTFTTQLDNIPIINPTTPTTTTPIINPTGGPFPLTTTTPTNPFPPTTTTSPPPPITTTQPTLATSTGAWCIASPTASETALQVALDYACGYGGADCSTLQPGATCYNPNTLRDHASYAFNDYYHKNPAPTSCAFGGTAQVTYTDPSSGNCHFSTARTTPSISPPATPMPMKPPSPINPSTPITNPAPFTPTSPTTVGFDPNGYGSEPTATPSSVASISCSLVVLLTTTCLVMSLNRAK